MTSTLTPRSASPVAAARPAIPAPTTTASRPRRQRRRAVQTLRRRKGAAAAVGRHGAIPRKVCAMLVSQPGMVSLRTAVNPASRSRCRNCVAPSNVSTLRHKCRYSVASPGLPPAGGNDDAPAHRVPDRGRGPGVAHRVVVHRQRGAGRQQVAQRPQLGVGIGQIADQIRGQDPVERAGDAVLGEAFDGCVHEPDRRRPRFALALRRASPATRRSR